MPCRKTALGIGRTRLRRHCGWVGLHADRVAWSTRGMSPPNDWPSQEPTFYTLSKQAGCWHWQAISTSLDPASRQASLQYFSLSATVHRHGSWAQVLASFSAIVVSFVSSLWFPAMRWKQVDSASQVQPGVAGQEKHRWALLPRSGFKVKPWSSIWRFHWDFCGPSDGAQELHFGGFRMKYFAGRFGNRHLNGEAQGTAVAELALDPDFPMH